MTNFFLMRHGQSEAVNYIAGRKTGIHLTEKGIRQVEHTAQYFSGIKIDKIFCSPIDRTYETAEIIGKYLKLKVEKDKELMEVDFGDWTGKSFDELKNKRQWMLFHTYRSGTRIPGGETMAEVQLRSVNRVQEIREGSDGKNILLVSHGDPLRCLIAYYLGIPLDFILRFEISTASVSILQLDENRARVLSVNFSGNLNRILEM